MQITKANYLGSFDSVASCPDLSLPEYAFIGRSNVGKSSLINMLCNRKGLAHVSHQPGKTRTINLYDIDSTWVLADLPGYGFAQVAKSVKKLWPSLIMDYLLKRKQLMSAFVLIDFRLPLQEIDRRFIAWLGENNIPFSLIYTKVDKVKKSETAKHHRQIENPLLEEWNTLPQRFMTSSAEHIGREELLRYIGGMNAVAGRK
jgi:GTP-binding protein